MTHSPLMTGADFDTLFYALLALVIGLLCLFVWALDHDYQKLVREAAAKDKAAAEAWQRRKAEIEQARIERERTVIEYTSNEIPIWYPEH